MYDEVPNAYIMDGCMVESRSPHFGYPIFRSAAQIAIFNDIMAVNGNNRNIWAPRIIFRDPNNLMHLFGTFSWERDSSYRWASE